LLIRRSLPRLRASVGTHPGGGLADGHRLTYFTRGAEWSDRDVRREAARYALAAMTAREPVTDWIIDDTGFPKQGTHSVGVQRQYSGTIGKIANCQVAASLTIATRTEHVPVDFALYPARELDRGSIAAGRGPHPRRGDVQDQARVGGRDDRAVPLRTGCRLGWCWPTARMATTPSFAARALRGLGYAVGLHRTTTVWRLDLLGRRIGDPWRSVIWPTPSGEVAFGG